MTADSLLLRLMHLYDLVDDPLEPLEEPLVLLGGALLDADYGHGFLVNEVGDPEHVDDLLALEGVRQVLLVREDHDRDAAGFVVRQHTQHLVTRLYQF